MSRWLLLSLFACGAAACEDPRGAPTVSSAPGSATTASPASPAKLDREAGCRALVAVVNRAADDSHAISGKISGDGTKELEALAASAARTKAEVEKLAIDDAKVSAARDAYLRMLASTVTAATQTVAAARGKDFEAMEKHADALAKAVASEEKVVGEINAACGRSP